MRVTLQLIIALFCLISVTTCKGDISEAKRGHLLPNWATDSGFTTFKDGQKRQTFNGAIHGGSFRTFNNGKKRGNFNGNIHGGVGTFNNFKRDTVSDETKGNNETIDDSKEGKEPVINITNNDDIFGGTFSTFNNWKRGASSLDNEEESIIGEINERANLSKVEMEKGEKRQTFNGPVHGGSFSTFNNGKKRGNFNGNIFGGSIKTVKEKKRGNFNGNIFGGVSTFNNGKREAGSDEAEGNNEIEEKRQTFNGPIHGGSFSTFNNGKKRGNFNGNIHGGVGTFNNFKRDTVSDEAEEKRQTFNGAIHGGSFSTFNNKKKRGNFNGNIFDGVGTFNNFKRDTVSNKA